MSLRGLTFIFAVVVVACEARHIPQSVSKGTQEPSLRAMESVSFNEVFNKVFEPKCVGCHIGPGPIDLQSPAKARAILPTLERLVLQERKMPIRPFQGLTDEERTLLAAWIKAGGPEFPLNGDAAPEITPLTAEFSSIRTKILVPKCIACHRPGGSAEKVGLSSVAEMVNSRFGVVIPGRPADSELLVVVLDDAREKMPPPRSRIAPLSEMEIQAMSQWILNGAKE